MYDLNSFELWRQRRAEMMREAERYRLARRVRGARQGQSAWHGYSIRAWIRAALRIAGEEA